MKAFIIAEHAPVAAECAAGARAFASEVAVALVGAGDLSASTANQAYVLRVPEGAVLDDAWLTLAPLIEGCEVVIAESTRCLKTVIGKLAAHKGASVITDILSLDAGVATTMYFGGIALSQRKASGQTAFYTASAGTFASALANVEASECVAAQELSWQTPPCALRKVGSEPLVKAGVDLRTVDVVVAAGRGFSEEATLEYAKTFAGALGGGLGCTRPLSEGLGWFSTDAYIGVSGLMLSPKVYVGIGISGQMQHMVGVNRADKVFAINKDKNAPLFKQCDMGLVGDLETVLPALCAVLS